MRKITWRDLPRQLQADHLVTRAGVPGGDQTNRLQGRRRSYKMLSPQVITTAG